MAIDSADKCRASNSNRRDLLGKLLDELKAGADSKGRANRSIRLHVQNQCDLTCDLYTVNVLR